MQKFFLLILLFSTIVFAQEEKVFLGTDFRGKGNAQGAFFDYSSPDAINIKVSIWGYVKMPGVYLVPNTINVMDLMSYAGGPSEGASLNDLRLVKQKSDSTTVTKKINYNDLYYEPEIRGNHYNPVLEPGDMIVVPGEPRLYFRDYLSLTLSVASTLVSIAILILNVTK